MGFAFCSAELHRRTTSLSSTYSASGPPPTPYECVILDAFASTAIHCGDIVPKFDTVKVDEVVICDLFVAKCSRSKR